MKCFLVAVMFILLAVACRHGADTRSPLLYELDVHIGKSSSWVEDSIFSPFLSFENPCLQDYLNLLRLAAGDHIGRPVAPDSSLDAMLHRFQERNADPYLMGRIHFYLGKHMQERERYSRADYHFSKSLERHMEDGGEHGLLYGVACFHLAQVKYKQRILAESGELCRRATSIFQEQKDTFYMASALVQSALVRMKQDNLDEAEKDLQRSLDYFSGMMSEPGMKDSILIHRYGEAFEAGGRILFRKGDYVKAEEFSRMYLRLFRENNYRLPSTYYYFMTALYSKSGMLDRVGRYCRLMMAAARRDNNFSMVFDGYRILSMLELESGSYQRAYDMNMEYNRMKDSLKVLNYSDNLLKFEKNYCEMEKERLFYKVKTERLQTVLYLAVLMFVLLSFSLFLYFRHKKLRIENIRLAETEKHIRWGFALTKEFISENYIAYDQLERVLIREKGRNNISVDLYNRFHEIMVSQKNSNSIQIIEKVAGLDRLFISRLQKRFPDLTADEILMSAMIHHRWEVPDMVAVLHISLEAVRKRKLRLAAKLSRKAGKKIDIDSYLSGF